MNLYNGDIMSSKFAKAVFLFKTKIVNPKLTSLDVKTRRNLEETSLSDFNLKRRNDLIKHAIAHSKFYRDKYEGLELSGKETISQDEFLRLPVLTRNELRENFDLIKADNIYKIHYEKVSTSGSTGKPVSVLHDRRHLETPIRWRILDWWGIKPWENQAFVYRYERTFLQKIRNTLLWWPTKRVFLAAANLTDEKLEKYVKDFNRIKPALFQGYVDVMFEFALYLLDNNIKIHPPKMVWVTSAPLFEEQREIMEKAFGAPVCDQYGNTEILLIAAECPEQNGLHMMQDTVHIEFVDENNNPVPPNTTGKILLTDLTNYAFPIIRYDIGDEGKYLDYACSCGRKLPLMDNVRGRQAFIIQAPSGLRIRGEHLMLMFQGYIKAFKEIQLHQEKDFSVCIQYVPREVKTGEREVQQMVELLKQRARMEINVDYKEVERIKRINKKTPLIISHLS